MAKSVSRPALGKNSDRAFNRPRASYVPALVPTIKTTGSLSRPSGIKWGKLQRENADAAPKIVNL